MKNIMDWVKCILIVLIIIFLIKLTVFLIYKKEDETKIGYIWSFLRVHILLYHGKHHEYPIGNNTQLVEKLFLENKEMAHIVKPEYMGKHFNDKLELIDEWGTPYSTSLNYDGLLILNSAGKNKLFDYHDDLNWGNNVMW